jgi:uncharacterized Zn finger protein (UPF0148 family)
MGTSAWVCFNCQTAVRRNTAFDGDVPCPTCGRSCSYLGYKIPVPPKSKSREWAALRDQLARERMQRELASDVSEVRDRHSLEQEIARLEALPVNEGRAKAIRLLQRRLSGSNA